MKMLFSNRHSNSLPAKFFRGSTLVLLGVLVAGCPAKKETPEVASSDKTVIRGSNTVGEELAPLLAAEFTKANPEAEFDMEFKGTAYGMGALMGGKCDVAAASRDPLKEELELARIREVELNEHVIGSYSVAIIVNSANSVSDLSSEQVRDIFTGAIRNWKEVGGADSEISLYARDPISGTYLGFKELAMENGAYATEKGLFTNYAGIVQAVAGDSTGIGYSSIAIEPGSGVKAVLIGGVAPSAENVHSKKYPYARTLRLYTNKATESSRARPFVDFVKSERGQQVLVEAGFVPRPPAGVAAAH